MSTFSRAFDQFSESGVLIEIHRAMIVESYGEKIAGHVSRDATAIEAREKPARKEPKTPRPKGKRGSRKKSEEPPPPPMEPKRLELQPDRSMDANLADSPQVCNVGTKKNSKGHCESWIGCKLHADVVDGEIPVSLILTSASVHDSQVAIPLAQMTSGRVTNLYDLMDAAYEAGAIHRYVRGLGHVSLIDPNPRSGEKVLMDPAQKPRYNQRTSVERVFSMLKDNHGGRHRTRSGSWSEKGDGAFNVWNAGHYRNTVVSATGLNFSLKVAGFRAVFGRRKGIYAQNQGKNHEIAHEGLQ